MVYHHPLPVRNHLLSGYSFKGAWKWIGGRWLFLLRKVCISAAAAAAAAKSFQLCPTLCDPIDGSLPGSPIPGILQARTLEWVAISFSNAWKWKVKVKSLSRIRPSATPWTAAHQAPPSMGLSRQEYWSGVPLPSLILVNEYPYNFNTERSQLTADCDSIVFVCVCVTVF